MRKNLLNLGIALLLSSVAANAQSIITFEDIVLPPNTSYLHEQQLGTYYTDITINSGTLSTLGRGYRSGDTSLLFCNVSNITDTSDITIDNKWCALSGKGYDNSNNYLVTNFPLATTNSTAFFTLNGLSRNNMIIGCYVNNSLFGFHEFDIYFSLSQFCELVFSGYSNGNPTGSKVSIPLADYRNNRTYILQDWKFVDLTPLGKVDSVTMHVRSHFYEHDTYPFVIDNIILSNGECPNADSLELEITNGDTYRFKWKNKYDNFNVKYDVTVDQTSSYAPAASSRITTVTNNEFEVNRIEKNTQYYLHIKPTCKGNTSSGWYAIPFSSVGLHTKELTDISAQINVYPNPSKDWITIDADVQITIEIYNSIGAKVISTDSKKIQVEHLPSGNYIIKATNNKGAISTTNFSKI